MNYYRKVPAGLGALTCIGKDHNKRRIIVPIEWLRGTMREVNEQTGIFKKMRSMFNKFTGKLVDFFDKNTYKAKLKERLKVLNATRAKVITEDYMAMVDDRLYPLTYRHVYT